jgi:hypothetical protein
MAKLVYLLCALTSVACGVMLLRGFFASRSRLLFWSGLCFIILSVNNVLLYLDLVMIPDVDLSLLRSLTALLALVVLLFGLVWELS